MSRPNAPAPPPPETVVNYNTFATGAVRPIRVDPAQVQRAPVIGFTPVGVVPSRGSLVVATDQSPGPRAVPRATAERPLAARLVPPPRPQPFAQKVVEIEKTGRPVARPVAIETAVGKPFVPGARPPAGVKAFSALAPEGSKELPGDAEPFDVPGARLSHHGGHSSFHAFLREYRLEDPVLARISRIIDEADTVQELNAEPAAPGLDLVCRGIRLGSPDDHVALERGGIVYDALYAQLDREEGPADGR